MAGMGHATVSKIIFFRHKVENFLWGVGPVDDMPKGHVAVQRNSLFVEPSVIEMGAKLGEQGPVNGSYAVLFRLLDA